MQAAGRCDTGRQGLGPDDAGVISRPRTKNEGCVLLLGGHFFALGVDASQGK